MLASVSGAKRPAHKAARRAVDGALARLGTVDRAPFVVEAASDDHPRRPRRREVLPPTPRPRSARQAASGDGRSSRAAAAHFTRPHARNGRWSSARNRPALRSARRRRHLIVVCPCLGSSQSADRRAPREPFFARPRHSYLDLAALSQSLISSCTSSRSRSASARPAVGSGLMECSRLSARASESPRSQSRYQTHSLSGSSTPGRAACPRRRARAAGYPRPKDHGNALRRSAAHG